LLRSICDGSGLVKPVHLKAKKKDFKDLKKLASFSDSATLLMDLQNLQPNHSEDGQRALLFADFTFCFAMTCFCVAMIIDRIQHNAERLRSRDGVIVTDVITAILNFKSDSLETSSFAAFIPQLSNVWNLFTSCLNNDTKEVKTGQSVEVCHAA
jgi:hypothetical protein